MGGPEDRFAGARAQAAADFATPWPGAHNLRSVPAALALALIGCSSQQPPASQPAPLPLVLHVRDARGQPLAGASIDVFRRAAEAPPEQLEAELLDPWSHVPAERMTLVTDTAGRAEAAVRAWGQGIELRVRAPGLRARGAWEPGHPLAVALTTRPGHDLAVLALDDDERPVAGAALALWMHRADGGTERVAAVRSDAQGLASFADVEGRWLEDARLYIGQDGLALPPIELEVERAALPLAQPLRLSLRARPVLELAFDGAEAGHGPLRLATAHVDADGSFTNWTWRSVLGPTCVLPGLDPDARLMLSAESTLLGSASALLEAEPLAGGARTARLRLENPGALIHARLRAPDGRWLADTWVETRLLLHSLDRAASSANLVRRLRTDAEGRLRVPLGPSLAEFQVRLVVLADPRDAAPCGASLSAQREGRTRTLELGDIDCAPYVRLCAGRVEDEAGAPLADVEVVARDQSFGEYWSTTSAGDGSFELWGLRRSDSLRIEAAGARALVELGSSGNVLRAGPPKR
jgi:hypothetical protein